MGKLIVLLLLSASVRADIQWSDNSLWNRARIITPGQHSWSFRTSYQHSSSRFGASGDLQLLGSTLSRSWSWEQIIAQQSNTEVRAKMNKFRADNNLSTGDVAATTDFEVQRDETMLDIAWAYGLTRTWMVGLEVPMSMVDTRLKINTVATPMLRGALTGASVNALSEADVRNQVQAAIDQQLTSEGYDHLKNRTQDFIVGDFSILSQVSLYQNADWTFSLQQLVRIPSAPANNVNDYVRYSRDDGQIDLGLTSLLDFKWRRYLFGAKLGYLAQLPDVQRMRVPVYNQNSVQVVDRRVNRDLGDVITASFETFYNLDSRWSMNGAYIGLFKGEDKYSGESNTAAYNLLSQNSEQVLHLGRVGISYLLGRPKSRSELERKWMVNANYYHPVAGLNVSSAPSGALELQAFF